MSVVAALVHKEAQLQIHEQMVVMKSLPRVLGWLDGSPRHPVVICLG